MAYIDEQLGKNEQMLYEARQHLVMLISLILSKLILIGIMIVTGIVSREAFIDNTEPIMIGSFTLVLPANQLIPALAGVISILMLIGIVNDYLLWVAERYIITDRRVIKFHGFANKTVIESSLGKINDIAYKQNLMGGLFGYATIEIYTASEDTINTMDYVAQPIAFKQALQGAIANYEQGYGYLDLHIQPGGPMTDHMAYRPLDINQTLEDLAKLRDRGILSSDEFETKKRELLNRL